MTIPTWPAVDAVSRCLEQIKRHNPLLNAIITPMERTAISDAERADAAARRGEWDESTLSDATAGAPPLALCTGAKCETVRGRPADNAQRCTIGMWIAHLRSAGER